MKILYAFSGNDIEHITHAIEIIPLLKKILQEPIQMTYLKNKAQ